MSRYGRCSLYSPTFFAYPHVCVLFNVLVLHSDVAALFVMLLVNVTILNKLYPDILYCSVTLAEHHATV